ncbi:uncharacterized protein LOC120536776 isoform X2 [Polypterus senegalus]|uniref:uncharacterized protein LOC120536776 isoform X2 n=1 Tax=Polypterus senegalus TaxID=55291 RepID=UPI001965FD16|nr:uncharacterized protein LOC120536776 isoform X2 [Polypterus senegalus]
MNYHVIFLLMVLNFLPQTLSLDVSCDPFNQTATVSNTAALVCKMANSDGGEVARIVWTNKDDDIIYNYVPSQQHFRRQKREKSRFAVNEESLKNGNIVLWISEVMSSDGGIYHCTVITEEEFVTKSINLLVQDLAPTYEEHHNVTVGPERSNSLIIVILLVGITSVLALILIVLFKYKKRFQVKDPFIQLLNPSIHPSVAEPI